MKKYKGMYKELFKRVYSINENLEECNSLSEAKKMFNVINTGSGAFIFEEEVNDGAVKIRGEVKEDEGKIQLLNYFDLYYSGKLDTFSTNEEELYRLSNSTVLIVFNTRVKGEMLTIEIYESVLDAMKQGWESLYFSKNEEHFATIYRGNNELHLVTSGVVKLVNGDKDITLYNDNQDEIRDLLENGDVEEQGYMIENNNWFSVSFSEYHDNNWYLFDDMPFEYYPKNLAELEESLRDFAEYFIGLRRKQMVDRLEEEFNEYLEELSQFTPEQLENEAYRIGIAEEVWEDFKTRIEQWFIIKGIWKNAKRKLFLFVEFGKIYKIKEREKWKRI